jgi:transcriptional regulator with XRE-family HTH domain
MSRTADRHVMHRRRNHPLVKLLRDIRRRHRKTQIEIEACMQVTDPMLASDQMLKRIEEGRRDLPGVLGGMGPPLSAWIESWLDCVDAREDERTIVRNTLLAATLGRMYRDPPVVASDNSED